MTRIPAHRGNVTEPDAQDMARLGLSEIAEVVDRMDRMTGKQRTHVILALANAVADLRAAGVLQ